MPFTGMDDLVSEITNGKCLRTTFSKTSINGATSAAGRWHSMFQGTGIPSAGSYSGTAGVATQLTKSSAGAFYLNDDVSSDTRHLLNMNVYTPSTVITPATILLVDLLLYYPSLVVTGTPTSLDNTATLPRYTDGKGVMAFVEVQTALGAARPDLTLTYRDQDGNDQAASLTLKADANSAPIGNLFTYNGNQFLPLNGADYGVKSIRSYTISTTTTGTVAFVLCKPLVEIPLLTQSLPSERDFLAQIPSMPRIYDGACLGLLYLIGNAMTTLQTLSGKYEYAWG